MSGSVIRRNTSKQGLHNLLRLTAQRSIDDAEESERERRRRAREAARARGGGTDSGGALQDSVPQPESSTPQSAPHSENSVPRSKDSVPQSEDRAPANKERELDAGLKPGCQATLEEDEGFSNRTLKPGGSHQHHPGQRSPEGAPSADGSLLFPAHLTSKPQEEKEENRDEYAMKERERSGEQDQREREEVEEEERTDSKKAELDTRKTEEKGEDKQTKVTYVSSIFLHQEKRRIISNGDAAGEEMTSCTVTTKRTQRSPSVLEEVENDTTKVEVKREMMWSSQRGKGRREQEEQLWRRQLEAEAQLEELRKRREERRRAREEDERRREEEKRQQLMQEEENRRQMKAEIERRRMEAAERMKNLSINEGEEPFSPVIPKSPTFKNETEERVTAENTSSIIERTESLNRSLKKNVKTLPTFHVSTIDDRLKQYTHALETSSKEGRHTLTDLPRSPEPVASKKSLFEAGDAWSQGTTKNQQHKDTDGLKVGMAGMVSHWVKENPESCSRKFLSKPSSVRAGDVLNKKNLWESVRAPSSGGSAEKGSLCGKRYTFVVTGHGKYEKMPVNSSGHE
ncbi:hypothetical protein ANANG_G00107740 [Anguilla anguilla]|uniref:Lymphocyte specific protein 1 a n=1 Tax=Anguilla anguilla TaxID=7936 RepID=A0A9D3MHV6_ANGAN|nr:hypothetical protein ANANG_G00107740 [Anguilla anguilla]